MQIVIDINEETYDYMTPKEPREMTNKKAAEWFVVLHKAIFVNGKVLPKGHGRLIDADALEQRLEYDMRDADNRCDFYRADRINTAANYVADTESVIEADKEGAEE